MSCMMGLGFWGIYQGRVLECGAVGLITNIYGAHSDTQKTFCLPGVEQGEGEGVRVGETLEGIFFVASISP